MPELGANSSFYRENGFTPSRAAELEATIATVTALVMSVSDAGVVASAAAAAAGASAQNASGTAAQVAALAASLQPKLDKVGGDASQAIAKIISGVYSSAVSRTIAEKLGEVVDIRDLGVNVGTTGDDALRIQAGLNDLGNGGGGTVMLNRGVRPALASNLIVPTNVEICGRRIPRGHISPNLIAGMQGHIVLDPAATISIGNASALRNLGILRSGLTFYQPIATALAAMQGCAVTIRDGSSDFEVSDCIILGFENAVSSDAAAQGVSGNNSRGLFFRVRGDCKNGILLANSYDISTLAWCHFWPYTTVASPIVTDSSQIERPGTALRLIRVNDWTQMIGNFSFGYNRGEYVTDAANVQSVAGKHDHGSSGTTTDGSIGFLWDGNAKDCVATAPQTAAKDFGFYNATPHSVELVTPQAWEFRSYGVVGNTGHTTTRGGFLRSNIAGSIAYGVGAAGTVERDRTRVEGTITEASTAAGGVFRRNGGRNVGSVTVSAVTVPSVASADPLTIPAAETLIKVTGTTNFGTLLNAAAYTGQVLRLIFPNGLTLAHGGTMRLAGSVNAVMAAGAGIALLSDGSVWREQNRWVA